MTKILNTLLILAACSGSMAAADAATDTTKPKPYTLPTCIVSGDKLGTMGDAVVVVRAGREIKFCCTGCIKDFDKDPAKFITKIDEAEAKAKADAAKPSTPVESGHNAHHE